MIDIGATFLSLQFLEINVFGQIYLENSQLWHVYPLLLSK